MTTTQLIRCTSAALMLGLIARPMRAQSGSFVYRLGKDTVAIEQFNRSATGFTGEVLRRLPTILRLQYEVTLGSDGRPTRAVVRQRQGDGSAVPNAPTETRLTFGADSIKREIVFADSTQTRMVAGKRALFFLTWPSVATAELLWAVQKAAPGDTAFPAIGAGAGVGQYGIARTVGDTMRIIGGPYAFRVRFDAQGRLLSVDGFYSTNKITGTRGEAGLDIAALAAKTTPMGQASARAATSAGFGGVQSPVIVDYGRPKVRERTVWGGTLIPFDSVWRAGANAATHLATSKTLAFGDVVIQPGIYTLWIQHARNGTSLIINSGVGQWGTQYDSTKNVGRAPMQIAATPEFVEELTVTVRVLPQNRGAIEFAWGPQSATATFVVRQ